MPTLSFFLNICSELIPYFMFQYNFWSDDKVHRLEFPDWRIHVRSDHMRSQSNASAEVAHSQLSETLTAVSSQGSILNPFYDCLFEGSSGWSG